MSKILVINPGSTSTKVALYENETPVFTAGIDHSSAELEKYPDVLSQFGFRADIVKEVLKEKGVSPSDLAAVVGRGGPLPNMQAGGYLVTKEMKDALHAGKASPHASNLGALIAAQIAEPENIPAYIYDCVSSDEFEDIARITGIPGVRRESLCHVLNAKAVARKVAKEHGKKYQDINTVVAHLGGGISISAHKNGRIIDCIRDDSGPFSPERCGGIPLLYFLDLCFSGEYTKKDVMGLIRGKGGMKAYLGTQDAREIEAKIAAGDKLAEEIYAAQAYQIAKGIGEMSTVLCGKMDCIILTGGMAYSKMMTEMIRERVSFIAPIEVVPGENEMEALALGALRMLNNEEVAKRYQS